MIGLLDEVLVDRGFDSTKTILEDYHETFFKIFKTRLFLLSNNINKPDVWIMWI